ncbi:hypothetical protein HYS47_03455 [Candidatus Woesearchaeota archaeon]|nr:hypothetical protein [Candidatus Woesearchaeota archaeon]
MIRSKAQLTGFILLAVVLLVLITTLVVLSKASEMKELEKKAHRIQEQLKQTGTVNTYITRCLQQSVEQPLLKILRQGGEFAPVAGMLRTNSTLLTVGIEQAQQDFPPEYPIPKTPLDDLPAYPFGKPSLPPLCEIGGANDLSLHEFAYPCPTGSYGTASIQAQLEAYSARMLTECANTSMMQELSQSVIKTEEPKVEIVLGKNDITAIAHYPIVIDIDGKEVTRLMDFEIVLPIRLKRMYAVAAFAARTDSLLLGFSPAMIGTNSSYKIEDFDDHMDVKGKEIENGTIIQLTDRLSGIQGKPVVFQFGRENRRPALDYIHHNEDEEYDIRVEEGEMVRINVRAIDPDELNHLLRYTITLNNVEAVVPPGVHEFEFPPGIHEMRVEVCDKGGLCDWQDIKILVSVVELGASGSSSSGIGSSTPSTGPGPSGTGNGSGRPAPTRPSTILTSTSTLYGDYKFITRQAATLASRTDAILLHARPITKEGLEDLSSAISPFSDEANDIFKLEIEEECFEGSCARSYKISTAKACTDKSGSETERCSASKGQYASTETLTCVNALASTTIEKQQGNSTGICNPSAAPSSPTGNYDSGGPYQCKATCNSFGRCLKPVECSCASGGEYTGDAACNNIPFSSFAASNFVFGTGGTVCNAQCKVVSLDGSEEACEFAKGPGAYSAGRCCRGCVTGSGECIDKERISTDKTGFCSRAAELLACNSLRFCTSQPSNQERTDSGYVYCGNSGGGSSGFAWQATPAGLGGACSTGGFCRENTAIAQGYYACQ